MFPNRRDFLKTSLTTGSLISWGATVPGFVGRTAAAAPLAHKAGAKDNILVVVQLTGGNDGLNTVIPFKDPYYVKLRPNLKIPSGQIKKIDHEVGLHPSLEGLSKLQEDGALCVVQGVGYPNPSQSHFRSMDIWQAASTRPQLTEGWLGNALKSLPQTLAIHLREANEPSPLAFAGAPVRVPSISTLEDFQLRSVAASLSDRQNQRAVMEGVVQWESKGPNLIDFVRRTAAETYSSSRRLQEIGRNYEPKAPYPNSTLGNHLQLAAKLIDAGLGARIFYVSLENFDTHANQLNAHSNLLRQLSEAVTAFYKDMAARGHQDRVMIMTFSEFGRRAHENGSRGTDHGSAAPMFLVGGKVKPGLVGSHPSLEDLEMGNLKHHTDFRQVYAAILDRWLGLSSKEILGQTFVPARIFAS